MVNITTSSIIHASHAPKDFKINQLAGFCSTNVGRFGFSKEFLNQSMLYA